jgi:periplasmic protein TonB
MRFINPVLGKALVLSLILHALALAAGDWLAQSLHSAIRVTEMRLDATLQLREALQEPQLPRLLDESSPPVVRPPAPVPRERQPVALADSPAYAPRVAYAPDAGSAAADEALRRANTQLARELLYPPEAIARGLEGQVLVLLFLDASGNAIAARLEASTGHALLDDAALRAAKTLRTLPNGVPREALLPVRFRLY